MFLSQVQEGLLNHDEAEKLFDEPKGDLPKKFEDLIENWEPTNKGRSPSKKKKIPMSLRQKIQRDLKF